MASDPQLRKDINALQEKLREKDAIIASFSEKKEAAPAVIHYVDRVVYRDRIVEVEKPIIKNMQCPDQEQTIIRLRARLAALDDHTY